MKFNVGDRVCINYSRADLESYGFSKIKVDEFFEKKELVVRRVQPFLPHQLVYVKESEKPFFAFMLRKALPLPKKLPNYNGEAGFHFRLLFNCGMDQAYNILKKFRKDVRNLPGVVAVIDIGPNNPTEFKKYIEGNVTAGMILHDIVKTKKRYQNDLAAYRRKLAELYRRRKELET